MFKQASRLLSRSVAAASSKSTTIRAFSSEVPSTTGSTFIEAWKKVAPNMDPPQTPSAFMKPRPSIPSSLPTKLTVNFVLPYAKEFSGENFDGVEQYARNKRIQVALTEKWADKYKNKLSAPWLG